MLAHPYDQRYIKLGYTSGDVAARVKKQQWACGEEYRPVEDRLTRKLPFAKFIDNVLKREFHNHRYTQLCGSCKKSTGTVSNTHGAGSEDPSLGQEQNRQHEEWYKLDPEVALAAVERWRRWVEDCRPFNRRGALSMYWSTQFKQERLRTSDTNWEQLLVLPSWVDWLCFGVMLCWKNILTVLVTVWDKLSTKRDTGSEKIPSIVMLLLWAGLVGCLILAWSYHGWTGPAGVLFCSVCFICCLGSL